MTKAQENFYEEVLLELKSDGRTSWGHQVKRGGKSVAGRGNRWWDQGMTSTGRMCRAWGGAHGERGVGFRHCVRGSICFCCAFSPSFRPILTRGPCLVS